MNQSNKRITAVVILIASLLIFSACGNSAKPLHESLNGSWKNDIMTVTFNFDKGIYSGVAMGETFNNKLTLVSEEANVVIFKSNENKIVCQFQENGGIMLTKEGGIPIILTRVL
jgi:hypothetical protein